MGEDKCMFVYLSERGLERRVFGVIIREIQVVFFLKGSGEYGGNEIYDG